MIANQVGAIRHFRLCRDLHKQKKELLNPSLLFPFSNFLYCFLLFYFYFKLIVPAWSFVASNFVWLEFYNILKIYNYLFKSVLIFKNFSFSIFSPSERTNYWKTSVKVENWSNIMGNILSLHFFFHFPFSVFEFLLVILTSQP